MYSIRDWLAANRFPILLFAASRAALFFLVYLSLVLLPVNPTIEVWHAFPGNLLLDGWVRWDSGWYYDIAVNGYATTEHMGGQTNVAFFPLYPLLIRALGALVGDPYLAGLLVANLAFLLALILLYRLARRHYGPEVAQRTLVLLVAYPFSFYFSAMYSESLFLLCVVAAFYFADRRQWAIAALCAALASATRIVGVVTVLGLLVLYLEQIGFDWRRVRRDIAWLPLGGAGLVSYMLFQAVSLDDPLFFIRTQFAPGWAGDTSSQQIASVFSSLSASALASGNFQAINLIHLLLIPALLLLAALAWRRPNRAYAVWSIVTILASASGWKSMGRYSIVLFPLFLLAALLLRREALYQAIVYGSVLLLALFTILYSHFYWVA